MQKKAYMLSPTAANFLHDQMKNRGVQSSPKRNKSQRISGQIMPFKITGEWETRHGEYIYSCEAHQVYFDGKYYVEDEDGQTFHLYSPPDEENKPSMLVGDIVTAVLRGTHWEIVGSPAEAGDEYITTTTAIITNASPGRVQALGSELVYGEMLNDYQVAPVGIKVLVGKIAGKWQVKETVNLTYLLVSPPPAMSINATAQTVTMATPYTAARIAGTITKYDGQTLTTFTNQTSPYTVTLDEPGWVSAYTTSNGLIDSPVVTRNVGVATTPIISYDPTTRRVTLTLPYTETGTTITMTVAWSDGSTPTTYTGRSSGSYITINKSATVSAWSVHSGWMNSEIVTKLCEVS